VSELFCRDLRRSHRGCALSPSVHPNGCARESCSKGDEHVCPHGYGPYSPHVNVLCVAGCGGSAQSRRECDLSPSTLASGCVHVSRSGGGAHVCRRGCALRFYRVCGRCGLVVLWWELGWESLYECCFVGGSIVCKADSLARS